MVLSIGVDVGGTKIAAGVVDEDGQVLTTIRRPSPANEREQISRTIADMANELAAEYDVACVGIGAAGFVAADRATIAYGTNLDWTGEPLGEKVSALCNLPVVVENDANAAGWAEHRFGAAKGKNDALIVTLGTGVGGAIVVNGELCRGGAGFASEIGHIMAVPGGRHCGCGQRGCLERYCSGTALAANARERAQSLPELCPEMIAAANGDADKITGLCVLKAARRGEQAALDSFHELAHYLGAGLATLAAVTDPEVIVLAGGLIDSAEFFLEETRESFTQHLTARAHRPKIPIVLAQAGAHAGLVGAADLARQ
ncbi:ROK family glucokinase [Actinomyces vulturis]|uniref:ROK family glucokinase n=1 Tax=Actinomyces vulturis TaxID=1857645 RepID=UPI0009F6757E|nr:ROK family glucokinase [Actinomyces vulturis]